MPLEMPNVHIFSKTTVVDNTSTLRQNMVKGLHCESSILVALFTKMPAFSTMYSAIIRVSRNLKVIFAIFV